MQKITQLAEQICAEIEFLPSTEEKVNAINKVRQMIHHVSPFKEEPVDFVEWVPMKIVEPNDYNPNKVAPPEMKLLKHSIEHDGYTQPIVVMKSDDHYRIIDGFHRNRVGKEVKKVKERIQGYLPVTTTRTENTEIKDRIAATIRHNRARGKHEIDSMVAIVRELASKGWGPVDIGKEIGMDADEVLRMTQFAGLPDLFKNHKFNPSWE